MRSSDHAFDWAGFTFTLLLVVGLALAVTSARLGLPYAYAYLFTQPKQATLAVATTPDAVVPENSPAEWSFASTTQRVINRLSISDAVPQSGKFIAADLVNMKLVLYQDGAEAATYPILTKGKPGTPWETPSGFYNVDTKEKNHFSSTGKVYMPYSMQFFGNYFIHGWPYYPDGTPVASTFSGGCIRLSTDDAAQVFAFADKGTDLFVYDSKTSSPPPSLVIANRIVPNVSARAYLVADIDTGDVFAEKNAQMPAPIASLTKLMTGLVANETINFEQRVAVVQGQLKHPANTDNPTRNTFSVGDLLYPLLMESNGAVAESLAHYYGTAGFVQWMNITARALDMSSTHFADPSGASPEDVSTPDDLFRLAAYLANKKSFVWDITRTQRKTVTATDGTKFVFSNGNAFASSTDFIGGQTGENADGSETMISVFSVPIGAEVRRVAVIVLQSEDYAGDVNALDQWFRQVAQSSSQNNAACATCAQPASYRQIEL